MDTDIVVILMREYVLLSFASISRPICVSKFSRVSLSRGEGV